MKNQMLTGMATMLVLATSVACSQVPPPPVTKNERPLRNQTMSGSYIAQVPGEGEQVIRRVFAEYGVVSVRPLGNDQFEFRLSSDPGIETLSSLAKNSGGNVKSIQPNYIYRIN